MSFPIIAQHGGLPDRYELVDLINKKKDDSAVKKLLQLVCENIPNIKPAYKLNLPEHIKKSYTSLELFLRMLFSALVDADCLDTEAHFDTDKYNRGLKQSVCGFIWWKRAGSTGVTTPVRIETLFQYLQLAAITIIRTVNRKRIY
ncbi:hypothetical protein JOC37_002088 [Desulfohalotomaculum tongense]|uniref:hypothetical protein n=1 Tax=Desulforadius tongensis TaxID=1216062 RepID=UPI00195EDCCD|nr:hypothetical protein [Desulforadius tongensis]MBM7855683.1 hypothetical protein [Desulforadius tongensis]